ncbi:hypothetical protein KIW84_070460 [Lathyrus oleraceus]|uniref:Uncharacterized protein n=1 Tax=Pisum sativum TaxID=3888 RepID=A0A9D4VG51_PEA|nr:hypothetical protein KIW84_070460 [Pisum sativum]
MIWEGCIDEVCDSDADDSEEESNQNPTNEAEDHLVQNDPNVTATDLEPRQRRLPSYLEDYDLSFSQTDLCAMLALAEDPLIFEDAVKEEKWRIAMKQEIQAIEKNNTWRLTELPSGYDNARNTSLEPYLYTPKKKLGKNIMEIRIS